MAHPRMRSNRLPVPPRPISSRVHGPSHRGSTESAVDHVRRVAREKRLGDRPFDPSKRGTWHGSSKDLVVNGKVEDECIVITLDGERSGTAIANPLDVPRGRHARETSLFVFRFGAYGDTKVAVWEAPDHIDSALEKAAEWLSDYAPGIFTEVNSEEDEVDMTYTESGYIASYEWHVDEITSGPLYDAALTESEKAFQGEYGDKYDHEIEQAPSGTGQPTRQDLESFVADLAVYSEVAKKRNGQAWLGSLRGKMRMPRDEFDRLALAAHQADLIELGRADLGLLDVEDEPYLLASELPVPDSGGYKFHFLREIAGKKLAPNHSRSLRQNTTSKYTLAGGIADDDQLLTELVGSGRI